MARDDLVLSFFGSLVVLILYTVFWLVMGGVLTGGPGMWGVDASGSYTLPVFAVLIGVCLVLFWRLVRGR
jgi:hypothetical protein